MNGCASGCRAQRRFSWGPMHPLLFQGQIQIGVRKHPTAWISALRRPARSYKRRTRSRDATFPSDRISIHSTRGPSIRSRFSPSTAFTSAG